MPWQREFHLNSFEPIGAHSEKAFTLPNFWDWSPWLILYFSVVANVVVDQKVPRHVHQVLVSLSWMVGNMKAYSLLKAIILYSNVFKPVRCEMPQIWSPHYSPGMVFSPDGGGAGRTKKSAFVSSIEIGSDTGLFPAFCRAAMASETMAQQESGLMRAGSGFVPCRSQENNHTKNANKLDGEIDIPICAMCVWFHNHPYSEFAGQSHVYLFLMFPMTMPL